MLFLICIACLLNVYPVYVHLPQNVVRSNTFWTPRRALSRIYHGHLPKKLASQQQVQRTSQRATCQVNAPLPANQNQAFLNEVVE